MLYTENGAGLRVQVLLRCATNEYWLEINYRASNNKYRPN